MRELGIKTYIDAQKRSLIFLIGDKSYGPFYAPLFKRDTKDLLRYKDLREFEAALGKVELKVCKSYAIFLLSKRNYSEKKLQEKLRLRWFSNPTVEKVISLLKGYGYVNDEKLASSKIKLYLSKGYGKAQILLKLNVEFGSLENLEQVFSEIYEVHFEMDFLVAKIRKRIKQITFQEKNKQYQFLRRKGHSHDLSLQVLDQVFQKN